MGQMKKVDLWLRKCIYEDNKNDETIIREFGLTWGIADKEWIQSQIDYVRSKKGKRNG